MHKAHFSLDSIPVHPHTESLESPSRRWRGLIPVALAATVLLPAAGTDAELPMGTHAVAERDMPVDSPVHTEHTSPKSLDYEAADSLIRAALAVDECAIKVSQTDIMQMYRQLFPPDTLRDMTTDELAKQTAESLRLFAMTREASGVRQKTEHIQRLEIDASSQEPQMPVSEYLDALRASAARWNIEVLTDWHQDLSGKRNSFLDVNIKPVGILPPQSRRVLVGLIRELETLPLELNEPRIFSRIVIGDIIEENVAGQVLLDGTDIYVDIEGGAVPDILTHEAGHLHTDADCGSKDDTDRSLGALKSPIANYANIDVSVSDFQGALTTALAASGLRSLQQRGVDNRLASMQLKPDAIAYAIDYGINTVWEDQATGFSLVLHSNDFWAEELYSAMSDTTKDTTRLQASLALLVTRIAARNPELAMYQVQSMRVARMIAEVKRRAAATSDTSAMTLFSGLTTSNRLLRDGVYGYDATIIGTRNSLSYYEVDQSGVCIPTHEGGKGAA